MLGLPQMGDAKRRKEQFRKTPQTCVLCGERPATTMDHVPPKGLFLPPRPTLITIPACEICNGGASEAEEKFRVYVSAKNGIDTPASIDFWKKGGFRTVKNNNRLVGELTSGTPLFIRSPSTGRFEPTRTFKWPRGAPTILSSRRSHAGYTIIISAVPFLPRRRLK